MKHKELLKLTEQDIDNLPDDPLILKGIIKELLSYVIPELHRLKEENQALKNEINRLKGEKGKPDFKKSKKLENKNLGELREETPEKKNWKKSTKKELDIEIHEQVKVYVKEEVCPKCKSPLCKNGSKKKVIQDVVFELRNTEYELEKKCCSNKLCDYSSQALVPDDLQNQEFGNNVRSLVPFLHYAYNLSQGQLEELLRNLGLVISSGTINNWIQEAGSKCIKLAEDVFNYHLTNNEKIFNTDVTGWKTKGVNKYLYVVCNENMSYYTIKDKYNSAEVNKLFEGAEKKDGVTQIYIGTDDHSSYSKDLVKTLGSQLCWIHELRHYKKLIPFLEKEKKEGLKVLDELYELYRKIGEYRQKNQEYNEYQAKEIENKFDEILTQKINWDSLNQRMALTLKKKERLLICLKNPKIEPHNNRAERDLRPCVVARKKSFGTRSEEGERHFASAQSVLGTLKKLGKNFFKSFQKILKGILTSQELIPQSPP